MSKKLEPMNDLELDRLLSAATKPPEFAGIENKLANRLAGAVRYRDNVVTLFKPAVRQPSWPRIGRDISIAAALAASMVVGILASSNLEIGGLMDGLTDTTSSSQVAEFAPSGLDELGLLEEDKLS